MISQFFKQYRRLTWFLGIPSSMMILSYLVRFFFLSRNHEIDPPGTLSPNNPITLSGNRGLNLSDLEDELSGQKRIKNPIGEKKIIPLQFPTTDSLKAVQSQEKNLKSKDLKTPSGEEPENNTYSVLREAPLLSRAHYYVPSQQEIQKFQNHPLEPRSNPIQFNSYSKPENSKEKVESRSPNILSLHTRIIGDQVVKEGSEIQIRTLENLDLEETQVPKNTTLLAYIHFERDRVICTIHTIRTGGRDLNTHLVSWGRDAKEGIEMNELEGGPFSQKGLLRESKNQILQDLGGEIVGSIPLGSSLVSHTARKAVDGLKRIEFKFLDGYEIHFTSI